MQQSIINLKWNEINLWCKIKSRMNIFTLLTCWTCSGDCLAPDFWATILILLALLVVTATVCVSSCLICLDDSFLWPIFWATMSTIRFIDCFFAPSMFGWGRETLLDFLVDGVSNPMLKSTSLSQARIPLPAVSMRVEIHASLNKILMPCDFLNSKKKWNTVQLSYCHASAIVWFVPTLSNRPLPHYSHPWQRTT